MTVIQYSNFSTITIRPTDGRNDGVNDYRMFIWGELNFFYYFYDEKLDADN